MFGCLWALAAIFAGRITLFFIWLLTDWPDRAFQTWYWPLLGFFFMPATTLAYMAAMLNNNNSVDGWWIVLLVVAIIFDLTQGRGRSNDDD